VGDVAVEDELPAGLAGGLEDRHQAVDVLPGAVDQREPRRVPHQLRHLRNQVFFRRAILVGPAQHRSFHQQHVDVHGRTAQEGLEELGLTAVGPKVAAVEQPLAVGLDQDGIGVVGRMVHQERRQPERADVDRLSVDQVRHLLKGWAPGNERPGRLQDPMRRLPHEEPHAPAQSGCQAVMVGMPMGDDNAHEGCIRPVKALHGWQRHVLRPIGVQGQADVQDKPFAMALQLDASSANLVRPAMDADPQAFSFASPKGASFSHDGPSNAEAVTSNSASGLRPQTS